jgi:DNA-binding transcriptional LysR family regulator
MGSSPSKRNLDVGVVRSFVAVAETGSVTLAARQLNLTQGAISQQIRRLEDLALRQLFLRSGRHLTLTAEAVRLLPALKQFLASNEAIVEAMRGNTIEGTVRFGAPYDIMGSYAPPILRRFSNAFPGIRVTLVCSDSALLLKELRTGGIDVALTTELRCSKGGETLRSDRLVWTGAHGGRAHEKDPLPVSLGADTCVFRPVVIAALKKVKRNWQAICEVSNMEPVRATLEADLAVAPLLAHSIPESLEIIPSNKRLPQLPLFEINLYEAPGPNRACSAFAGHVRRTVTKT